MAYGNAITRSGANPPAQTRDDVSALIPEDVAGRRRKKPVAPLRKMPVPAGGYKPPMSLGGKAWRGDQEDMTEPPLRKGQKPDKEDRAEMKTKIPPTAKSVAAAKKQAVAQNAMKPRGPLKAAGTTRR